MRKREEGRGKREENRNQKIGFYTLLLFLFSFFPLPSSLFLLTSCGFEPVYGINRNAPAGVESYLEQIDIATIPDREGQYLRNALIDRFYRDARPHNAPFRLQVNTLQETKTDLDITKTADATRAQLRLDSSMRLYDQETGQVVLSRPLRAITSYNVLPGEFATRVTEENARENALNDLARQIEQQLVLYFKRSQ